MAVRVRDAVLSDADGLAELWSRYLASHYGMKDGVGSEALLRDGLGPDRVVQFTVAETSAGLLCGAAGWGMGYDLHHFVHGVDVHDLFVDPERRGRGIAVQLLAHVAATAKARGARYMRGGASLEPTPARRLYDRAAVYFDGKTANISARAFDHLASLDGASPRELARSLPQRHWNFEPS
jgi:GNAT superfamily N-acetyltransferase